MFSDSTRSVESQKIEIKKASNLVKYSTFSKASKPRGPEVFEQLFKNLVKSLKSQARSDKIALFPLDSTTITLTIKLLWKLGYHQVKLFSGLNSVS